MSILFRMNKNTSHRSKRCRIQEQLFAYASDDSPIILSNVHYIENDQSTSYSTQTAQTNFEVLPEVIPTSDVSPNILPSMDTSDMNYQHTSSSNQIFSDIQYVPQSDIN